MISVRRFRRHDIDAVSIASFSLELDNTADSRVKRIVPSLAHIAPGMNPRAALANQDGPGAYQLASVALDAEAF